MALIKLARKLGLIETIYVDGIPNASKSTAKSRKLQQQLQPYEYIIAVDFEATCWENAAPPKWRQCEIIEFSAVLANLKTGKVEAEFQKYIMPIESPKLSEYCIKMTGITQKTIDNGIPLQTALIMFQEWLRKELRTRNLLLPKMSKDNLAGNVVFVTWSDFETFLSKECQRKNLKKAPFFNQWIDVKTIYRQWYKIIPKSFIIALTNAGLTFEGSLQSGIDEAKNLAALTHKMVSEGATLQITSDLNPLQQNFNFVL